MHSGKKTQSKTKKATLRLREKITKGRKFTSFPNGTYQAPGL